MFRSSGRIVVDGKLDEPAWQQAPSVGDFHFNWWKSGDKEQTIAKLLWDDENLYVGCYRYDKHISADVVERHGPVSRGEFQHRLHLFPRHVKLLHDFFDRRTRLQVFKHRSYRHTSVLEHPCAAAPAGYALHGGTLGPI